MQFPGFSCILHENTSRNGWALNCNTKSITAIDAAQSATVRIAQYHTNIVFIEKNGETLLDKQITCNMQIAEEGLLGDYGANVGQPGRDGMRETDKEIVKIMMQSPT